MKHLFKMLFLLLFLLSSRMAYGQNVWELVTDYSNLSTADTYVIAGNHEPDGTVWHSLKNNQVTNADYLPIGSTLTISENRITSAITDNETWTLESTGTPDEYFIKSTKGNYYLQNSGDTKSSITFKPSGNKLGNAKWKIHFKVSDDEGNYTVTGLYNGNISPVRTLAVYDGATRNWHAETQSNYKWFRDQEVVLFKKVANAPATVTSAEYATFSSPYALDFSAEEGLTVYTASVNAAQMKVLLRVVPSKRVPANTGVVLHGAAGTYKGAIVASADALVDNDLHVAESEMSGAGNNIYVLNKKNGVTGFYRLSDTGTLDAGKAYLTLDAGAPVLTFSADAVTSLEHTRTGVKTDTGCYSLDGRNVACPSRGVFIKNGRKVIVK